MGLVRHWIVRDNVGDPRIVFDVEQLAAYRNSDGWQIEGPFGAASAETEARAWHKAYEDFERTGSMAALNRMGEAARRGEPR